MGFYLEENCQTEAHEPLLDWASGRKAPVLLHTGSYTAIVFRGGPDVDFEVHVAKFKKYFVKKIEKCIHIFKNIKL